MKLAKTYNCQLPKPDSQGRYRPVVGKTPDGKAVKFTVGNKRTVTTAEAQRRLDYIRMLYQKQCEAHGIDRWMYCYLTWAKKFQAGPVKASGSELTARDSERAAAELAMIHQLMEWGLPITIINHDLQVNGQAFISERIETEVNRAVAEAIHKLGMRWGDDFIDSVRAEVIPENIMQAETTGFHAALDAFGEHIKTTGTQVPKRLDRLKYLKQAHEDFPSGNSTFRKSSNCMHTGVTAQRRKGKPMFQGTFNEHHQGIQPFP